MFLVNWFNIGYLAISARGGKYGFFILAGYWVYHPWILCAYGHQASDEKAYGKNMIWFICGTGLWGTVSVLLVPWLFGRF